MIKTKHKWYYPKFIELWMCQELDIKIMSFITILIIAPVLFIMLFEIVRPLKTCDQRIESLTVREFHDCYNKLYDTHK